MKAVAAEELQADALAVLNKAQKQRLLIMRNGRPCALIVGLENYDQEDLELARSPEFWSMIRERRKGPMIPWAEVERRLARKKARKVKSRS